MRRNLIGFVAACSFVFAAWVTAQESLPPGNRGAAWKSAMEQYASLAFAQAIWTQLPGALLGAVTALVLTRS